MVRKMRKEKAEVEEIVVVLGVEVEEEVLGESSMVVWILILTLRKKLGLWKRLKRRLIL